MADKLLFLSLDSRSHAGVGIPLDARELQLDGLKDKHGQRSLIRLI